MWSSPPKEIPPGSSAVLTVPEFGHWSNWLPPNPEIAYAHDPRGEFTLYAYHREWFLIVVEQGARRVRLTNKIGEYIPLVHYGHIASGKRVFTSELDPLAETLYEKFGT